jgi:hypothetical protein
MFPYGYDIWNTSGWKLKQYLCVLIYTNKLSGAVAAEMIAKLTLNLA